MDDLISRQAAIDVAFDVFPDDEYFREQFVKGIVKLPTAQPEIIRCKDCKHWLAYGCWELGCKDAGRRENDYCSFAERRSG